MYVDDYKIEALERAIQEFKGEGPTVQDVDENYKIAKHLEELLLDIKLDPDNNY